MPILRGVNKDFFKAWSAEMAYVLGFFAADGSMVKTKRGTHFIEFCNTDRVIMEDIKEILNAEHTIASRIRKGNWRTLYRLQIGSKEIFRDLQFLGFTQGKSNVMLFPHVPDQFFRDFVRGYFDGDGNVYFKKHWVSARNKERWVFSSRFTSGSRIFLQDLLKNLQRKGVHGGFILKKNRGFELVLSHHDSLVLFDLLYNNAHCSVFLKRKRLLFERAVKTLYGKKVMRE